MRYGAAVKTEAREKSDGRKMMGSNPMGLNGPNWSGNAEQPDFRNPVPPSNQPNAGQNFPVGMNPMGLDGPSPTPAYVQPGFPDDQVANEDALPFPLGPA
jgi:hypothetical protein